MIIPPFNTLSTSRKILFIVLPPWFYMLAILVYQVHVDLDCKEKGFVDSFVSPIFVPYCIPKEGGLVRQ